MKTDVPREVQTLHGGEFDGWRFNLPDQDGYSVCVPSARTGELNVYNRVGGVYQIRTNGGDQNED